MQAYRLTVDKFLDHAAKWFGDRAIVEADAGRVVATVGIGPSVVSDDPADHRAR